MSVPDFQSMMYPLLNYASDHKEHQISDFKEFIRNHFNLSSDDANEKISSGSPRYVSNAQWAITYLYQSGLLTRVSRGTYSISPNGVSFLQQKQTSQKINIKDLQEFDSFRKFVGSSNDDEGNKQSQRGTVTTNLTEKTPDELIQESYNLLCASLAKDLLDTIKERKAEFFETLVVDLLIRMGYGGSRTEAGQVVGKSGDGGIDGIIKEDKLGLDAVYVQAKRYDGIVPIKEVRDFAGALTLKKSHKGIFLTTSSFPDSAYNFVKDSSLQIVLIDGERLAELMIEHNVGVSVRETYQIKRIDSDYFNEDDM